MSKKTPLTQEQLDDAARLKAIWLAKKNTLGLTQEHVGERLDGISQGAVSHYLNGVNALNLQAAVVFSELLDVPVGEFSPSLEAELNRLLMKYQVRSSPKNARLAQLADLIKDFSKTEFSELTAQIDLIIRRKNGKL